MAGWQAVTARLRAPPRPPQPPVAPRRSLAGLAAARQGPGNAKMASLIWCGVRVSVGASGRRLLLRGGEKIVNNLAPNELQQQQQQQQQGACWGLVRVVSPTRGRSEAAASGWILHLDHRNTPSHAHQHGVAAINRRVLLEGSCGRGWLTWTPRRALSCLAGTGRERRE
ncbi:hypothetical protein E2C01_045772 [Portunus trituberculatus]|uniref:Uncharacterized protein n=1 Tax=Portunus trituberculatus TaxID=210409 RepID=A0A5B7G3A8_PORTR|nr:hypothetical protein [Portunus trituberculatus]